MFVFNMLYDEGFNPVVIGYLLCFLFLLASVSNLNAVWMFKLMPAIEKPSWIKVADQRILHTYSPLCGDVMIKFSLHQSHDYSDIVMVIWFTHALSLLSSPPLSVCLPACWLPFLHLHPIVSPLFCVYILTRFLVFFVALFGCPTLLSLSVLLFLHVPLSPFSLAPVMISRAFDLYCYLTIDSLPLPLITCLPKIRTVPALTVRLPCPWHPVYQVKKLSHSSLFSDS